LRIDLVVLSVRADEPDIDDAIRIIDPHHDAILVAGDGKDRATIVENARAAALPLPANRCPARRQAPPRIGRLAETSTTLKLLKRRQKIGFVLQKSRSSIVS
jgi:hypothetical protein